MPKYAVTYVDYTEELPCTKQEVLHGRDVDDMECNLYRKTKCERFEILSYKELQGFFKRES
jgi:hypothetical protein